MRRRLAAKWSLGMDQFIIGSGSNEIIELLGSGGMANVYRAHDPHLGRDVAVKVLQLDGGLVHAVQREVR